MTVIEETAAERRRQIAELEDYRDATASVCRHAILQPIRPLLLPMIATALLQMRAELLDQEKAEGCRHCGAQHGEDCRQDWLTDCLWAEDARKLYAPPQPEADDGV